MRSLLKKDKKDRPKPPPNLPEGRDWKYVDVVVRGKDGAAWKAMRTDYITN